MSLPSDDMYIRAIFLTDFFQFYILVVGLNLCANENYFIS